MKINWKLLWESIKLPLRLILLAVVPFLLTYLTEVNTFWAGLASTILIVIDRYLHLLWEKDEEDKRIKVNERPIGISPF